MGNCCSKSETTVAKLRVIRRARRKDERPTLEAKKKKHQMSWAWPKKKRRQDRVRVQSTARIELPLKDPPSVPSVSGSDRLSIVSADDEGLSDKSIESLVLPPSPDVHRCREPTPVSWQPSISSDGEEPPLVKILRSIHLEIPPNESTQPENANVIVAILRVISRHIRRFKDVIWQKLRAFLAKFNIHVEETSVVELKEIVVRFNDQETKEPSAGPHLNVRERLQVERLRLRQYMTRYHHSNDFKKFKKDLAKPLRHVQPIKEREQPNIQDTPRGKLKAVSSKAIPLGQKKEQFTKDKPFVTNADVRPKTSADRHKKHRPDNDNKERVRERFQVDRFRRRIREYMTRYHHSNDFKKFKKDLAKPLRHVRPIKEREQPSIQDTPRGKPTSVSSTFIEKAVKIPSTAIPLGQKKEQLINDKPMNADVRIKTSDHHKKLQQQFAELMEVLDQESEDKQLAEIKHNVSSEKVQIEVTVNKEVHRQEHGDVDYKVNDPKKEIKHSSLEVQNIAQKNEVHEETETITYKHPFDDLYKFLEEDRELRRLAEKEERERKAAFCSAVTKECGTKDKEQKNSDAQEDYHGIEKDDDNSNIIEAPNMGRAKPHMETDLVVHDYEDDTQNMGDVKEAVNQSSGFDVDEHLQWVRDIDKLCDAMILREDDNKTSAAAASKPRGRPSRGMNDEWTNERSAPVVNGPVGKINMPSRVTMATDNNRGLPNASWRTGKDIASSRVTMATDNNRRTDKDTTSLRVVMATDKNDKSARNCKERKTSRDAFDEEELEMIREIEKNCGSLF